MVDSQKRGLMFGGENIKKFLVKFFTYRFSIILVLLIFLIVFFIFTSNYLFISTSNITTMLRLIPELGIVTLGVGLLMISGEFDLSVGSTVGLCAYIFAISLGKGINSIFVVVTTLGAGFLVGLINGLLTVKGRIPSFIATLGMMLFWKGVLYLHSGMLTRPLRQYLLEKPLLEKIFISKIGIFPVQVFWFLAIVFILGLILHFHKFGNWVYVTGDNKMAARAMGINTDQVKTICFIIVGLLCALSSIIQDIWTEEFIAFQGKGYELKAIAGSVVGGTSIFGGVGSMVGIFLGAIVLPVIENGLVFQKIPMIAIDLFVGLSIVIFVILYFYLDKRRMW
jgi:simple sugar transport system permease protein